MKKIKILFPEFLEMLEKLCAAGIQTQDYQLVARCSTHWTKEVIQMRQSKVRGVVFLWVFFTELIYNKSPRRVVCLCTRCSTKTAGSL